ncbi:hypothetical protein AMECASPLE_004261, partial [Ameca splendens]
MCQLNSSVQYVSVQHSKDSVYKQSSSQSVSEERGSEELIIKDNRMDYLHLQGPTKKSLLFVVHDCLCSSISKSSWTHQKADS